MKFKLNCLVFLAISLFTLISCDFGDQDFDDEYETISMITSVAFKDDLKVFSRKAGTTSSGADTTIINTTYIAAEDCRFTIDQKNKHIYTSDSLPFGTDVSNVTITIGYKGYNLTKVLKEDGDNVTDTTWSNVDPIDLRKPVKFKVYAQVINVYDIYTVEARVHQVDPMKMGWTKISDSFSGGEADGEQRSILFNGKIYTFAYTGGTPAIFSTDVNDGNSWRKDIPSFPESMNINSVCTYGRQIYMASTNGNVYTSDDGLNWSKKENLSGNILTFVGKMQYKSNERLIALSSAGEGREIKVSDDGQTWQASASVSEYFPEDCFSGFEKRSLTNSSINNYYVMGRERSDYALSDTASFAWFTLDGLEWAEMRANYTLVLPKMTKPTYMFYGDETLAFGYGPKTAFESFYYSEDLGLVWREKTGDPALPEEFAGRNEYSSLVDDDDNVWIIWSASEKNSDEVWRGKINKAYFSE